MKNQTTKADVNGVTHVTPINGNVFDDLGFAKPVAEDLQKKVLREIEQRNNIKRVMVDGLKQEIARRGLSAEAAASILAISRPRLSDITRFKVEKFSIDCVSDLMTRMGQTVHVVIDDSPNISERRPKSRNPVSSE